MKASALAVSGLLAISSLGAGPARAASPALFDVGFAVREINPVNPQYLGGFDTLAPPTKVIHDPMQVRAMAIRHGDTAVLFAIVDTQGYFAGNQEGPYGSRDARLAVASTLASEGLAVTEANIIVSSTHSHAAPTIMGIWGPTDPTYLRQVYQGTVDALLDAAHTLRPAYLYAAKADVRTVNVEGVSQTDGYQGWRAEGDLPVLWARDPATGATLGLYANVPTHADVVPGSEIGQISADHIGVERDQLDRDLGGTSVVAMGTLGRQESIVQYGRYEQAEKLGGYITNEIERSLADARPITDDTLAASEQYMLLPSTNPLLLGLDLAWQAGPDNCVPDVACPIDRAILPPYAVGANLGTWFTAFRIGDIVYATEPGEAFPEVSVGIRRAMGAPDVRIVGMAQDQLGYYFPPETYPFTEVNNSDHQIYNASIVLGDANVQAHVLNARALGFEPQVVHESVQFDDPDQATRAGVQFFPVPREQQGATFLFDTKTSSAVLGRASVSGKIRWSFGDGGTAKTGTGLISHTFAAPGSYSVVAEVTGSDGRISRWQQSVIRDSLPQVTVEVGAGRLSVSEEQGSGSGTAIAARWTFSDGTNATGLSVPGSPSSSGSVLIVDSAGNTALGSF